MYRLNQNIVESRPAPVPQFAEWIDLYKSSDRQLQQPLISLAPGHPAHPPHADILKRIGEAAEQVDNARYGFGQGRSSFRQALATEMHALYADADESIDDFGVTTDDIAITLGANQAIYVSLQALAKAGDEVILTSPFFFNNEMALNQLGITPVYLICKPEQGFMPDPAKLQPLITSKTKAILLVSPNNPTGATIPTSRLEQFAEIAASSKVALILDETYRDLLPDAWPTRPKSTRIQPHRLFGRAFSKQIGCKWQDYLIQTYSFSKAYAMPGYRIGSLVASPTLIKEALKIIDTQTICPAQITQDALTWAIPNTIAWRDATRTQLNARLDLFCKAVDERLGPQGWRIGSAGAFYAFLRHPFTGRSSTEVAKAMVERVGVAVLPAAYFMPAGQTDIEDCWLRCSIPNVEDAEALEAVERLIDFVLP